MQKNCEICSKAKPIVNKKYGACDDCNYFRIHGVTKQEAMKGKQAEWMKKMQQKQIQRQLATPKKPTAPIKQQTSKESSIKTKLACIKREIDLEEVQNGTYFCKGCGHSHVGLDKSHILSVGLYKHLELVKENMQLMCRKCHTIWESGTIEEKMELLCFAANLLIIQKYDIEAYNKLITKVEEYENNYFKK